jgi:hypothetical protein
MKLGRSLIAAVVTTGLGVGVFSPVVAGPPARSDGAVFLAGAATRNVSPQSPTQATHVGGYGDCRGCPTTAVRAGDAFAVRAMYVSNGKSAVVLVSAPFEGWFAGYQQEYDATGNQVDRLGITSLRQDAAARLSHDGLAVTSADVLVSTVHCHACPTLIGVWGPTNVDYLRFVYRQTLDAIAAAQAAAVPARLRWATADFGYVNDVTVGQANANEGWPIDGQLSVLQATGVARRGEGGVVATYVDVPVHGNIVWGPGLHEMNDEHFGAAAQWLEAHVGGVAVVAAGTLGDQTSPMQGDDTRMKSDPRPAPDAYGYPRAYDDIDRLGALTGSTVVEALSRHGHVVASHAIGGAESYQLVPVNNPVILGLFYGHALPPNIPMVTHDGTVAGQQTADRAILPPYMVGDAIGVWFTVLRIGGVAVVSEPGEAFPHVSFAIRAAITGAEAVFTVGNAQDQLGYYYEEWAYPGTFYYSADHYLYNVGPTLAQQNIVAATLGAQSLGFAVAPTATSMTSAADNDYTRIALKAGVQVWGFPQGMQDVLATSTADGITIPIGVFTNHARGSEVGVPGAEVDTAAPVVTVDGVPVDGVTTSRVQFVPVTFPCPGTYLVAATLPGTSASWSTYVHVYGSGVVTNTAVYPDGTGPHPLASQNRNDGPARHC